MGIQRLQPVSGGTDWGNGTPFIHRGPYNVSPSATVTYLDITGKGILTGITVILQNSASAEFLGLGIELDGTKILYETDTAFRVLENHPVTIPLNHRFNNRLKVLIRSLNGSSTLTFHTLTSYVLF